MGTPNHQPVDTTAGEAYEKHIVPAMFVSWAKYAVNWAAPRAGEQVLDVACGTGIGARTAAKCVGPAGKVVGLDIDPGVVEVARRAAKAEGAPIEWHCASALEMPVPDGAFDLALCLQGLQFFPDRVAGFAEIRRALKPAGRLVATLWCQLEFNKGHEAMVRALESQKVDASAAKKACTFADIGEIRDSVKRGGFKSVEIRTENDVTDFPSFDSFIEGMTVGAPSARRALALLPAGGYDQFVRDVKAALKPYLANGRLAYPMRTHILLARP
jgi:SAM-dependent methyltransferase